MAARKCSDVAPLAIRAQVVKVAVNDARLLRLDFRQYQITWLTGPTGGRQEPLGRRTLFGGKPLHLPVRLARGDAALRVGKPRQMQQRPGEESACGIISSRQLTDGNLQIG
jgi:hypothetical protein